jgi:zinc/manganese transport system substrate-binding protein
MKSLPKIVAIGVLLCTPAVMAKTVNTVVSFSVLADMVQQVGGKHVVVNSLVGANGDPHSFEPSPKDSRQLATADVVFVSGLGLEGWMDRLISASGYRGKVVSASQGVHSRQMEDDGKTITDPHAWNSMANGVIYAQNIMNALIAVDPQDADDFRKQGAAYIEKLQKLDSWAKTEFAGIPDEKRHVLTSHDAFGYFGQEYNVKFMAPVGFSTESEASASGVADLIKQIKSQKIKYYFFENQTDPRLVKQIAAATGAQSGGELYPEALSDASGPASTYEQAFKHNVESIVSSMK